MRYRAPVLADAPAVLAVFEARDTADLGEVEQTLPELLDEWRGSDLDLEQNALVAEDADGRIVAYAAVRRPGTLVLVAPAYEGRGIGSRLLEWTERRDQDRGRDVHRQWVAATNASARSLLTRAGYHRVRSYSRMVLSLSGAPVVTEPPAGFSLRSLDPVHDAVAVHALDAASFASAPDYTPESLTEFTGEHFGAHDFDAAISRVVVEGGRIVGFLIAGRRPEEEVGYVHILAVTPERQDRGLGTAMLRSAFAGFAAAGIREIRLGVASHNPRALYVYERLGMIERYRFDIYERALIRRRLRRADVSAAVRSRSAAGRCAHSRRARDNAAQVSHAAHRTDAGAETGSWFPVPDEAELPDGLRGLFGKARERLGFVPNVFRVYAFRPERLSAWFAHFRQLHVPSEGLSAADREMVAVVVSSANGCLYCLVAHGAALREELGDPVLGERISYDWRRADLDPRRAAICAYAEKLTLHPREVTREDLQTLLDVGLTLEEAWDVAELAAMYNLTNRMAMATNMLPNPEYSAQARPQ